MCNETVPGETVPGEKVSGEKVSGKAISGDDLIVELRTRFPALRDLHVDSMAALGELLDDVSLRTAVARDRGAVPVEPAKTRVMVTRDGGQVRIPRPVIVIDSREQPGNRDQTESSLF